MKKYVLVILAFAASVALFSCSSTKVERVDSEEVVDMDGYWNDSDVRIVCESLINDCVSSKTIANYSKVNGRAPVAIVGKISNDSDEHIDTSIVAKRFQNAIINSGVMEFVSDKFEREELREERFDQADNASEKTAKAIGNETGADYMLLGSIKSIVQKEGNKSVRAYFVYAELHDMESNKIVWSGENSSIKKIIKRPSAKF
ncbi:MAG: penicillin-binding protein activator LpoB [Treponema sp.]